MIKVERPGVGRRHASLGAALARRRGRQGRGLFPRRQPRQEIGGDRFREAGRRGAGPASWRQEATSSSRISRSAASPSSASTPQALRAANPRLIVASITGFGQDGPYAERAGYDFIIQGMGGMMSVTGLPDGEPGGGPMRVWRRHRRPVHRHVHAPAPSSPRCTGASRRARARTSTWPCSTPSWRCSPTRRRMR